MYLRGIELDCLMKLVNFSGVGVLLHIKVRGELNGYKSEAPLIRTILLSSMHPALSYLMQTNGSIRRYPHTDTMIYHETC